MKIIDTLLERLSEQSTWRGIIGILMASGITLAPDMQNGIIALGLSLIGLINIVRKEHKTTIVTTAPITITGGATVESKS